MASQAESGAYELGGRVMETFTVYVKRAEHNDITLLKALSHQCFGVVIMTANR